MTDMEKVVELLYNILPPPVATAVGIAAYKKRLEASHMSKCPLFNGVTIREPGVWKTDKEDIEWGNSLKRKYCSKCGQRPYFDKEKREFVLSAFCPHCGSPMKGESNETLV